MEKFQCTIREFGSSIDNLGWMCHIKHEGDGMEKFQCTSCGKISTDKNEICKAQDGIGAGCLYVSRLQ